MKAILVYSVIMFIGFATFSQQQDINPCEVEAITIEDIFSKHQEDQGINKYGQMVFQEGGNDLEFTSLTLAVMRAESNFKHDAKSNRGAVGLMQLMPSTAFDISQQLGMDINENDLVDPAINIKLGMDYIKYIQDRLEGIEDEERRLILVWASYNSGLHTVKRAFKCRGFDCYIARANLCSPDQFNAAMDNLPEETQQYLEGVKNHYDKYKKAFNVI